MRMEANTPAIVMTIVCASLVACSLEQEESCEGESSIRGVLTQAGERHGQSAVLIEEDPSVSEPGDAGGAKVWLFIERQTELMLRLQDGSLSRATEADLVVGAFAKGWFSGALDSYPGQAAATCIAVVEP